MPAGYKLCSLNRAEKVGLIRKMLKVRYVRGAPMTGVLSDMYKKSHQVRLGLLILAFSVFFSILIYPSIALAVDVILTWDPTSGADGYRLFYRKEGNSYDYNSPDWEAAATTATVTDRNDRSH